MDIGDKRSEHLLFLKKNVSSNKKKNQKHQFLLIFHLYLYHENLESIVKKYEFQYKCDNFYHPEADGGISILDESLGIDWRIPTEHANLSEKDTKHEVLKDFDSPFEY